MLVKNLLNIMTSLSILMFFIWHQIKVEFEEVSGWYCDKTLKHKKLATGKTELFWFCLFKRFFFIFLLRGVGTQMFHNPGTFIMHSDNAHRLRWRIDLRITPLRYIWHRKNIRFQPSHIPQKIPNFIVNCFHTGISLIWY